MPRLLRSVLTGALAALVCASDPAAAAGKRSFVSTSGVDNPTCSIASPCRTFGAAVTATPPGGEVIVLNSGGYGPVTITQSVSIIAPPGVYAGISVSSGNGVDILTGPGDSVTLRGLTINNVGAGITGIHFTSNGRLQVEDVQVSGFSFECLLAAPAVTGDLVVERSSFIGCGWGIVLRGGAVVPVGSLTALIDHVSSHHNVHEGISAEDIAHVVIRNSSATFNASGVVSLSAPEQSSDVTVEVSDLSHNTIGAGAFASPIPGLAARLAISRSEITHNGTGILSGDSGSVIIAGTTITRNDTGISYAGSGVVSSQGNNLISGNGADGTSPTVVGSK